MAPRRQTAAEYIEEHDFEMRVILGELAENAGQLNMLWTLASMQALKSPQLAFDKLIEALTVLDVPVRIERTDGLRTIRSAIKRLDAELPDDEDDHSTDPPDLK
jgi:hypothetical protein